ncbi:MAG: primosomal protein N' [Bacteroidales bacterium]|nr:primosomal protein N' [Bacteroidales bacterium]
MTDFVQSDKNNSVFVDVILPLAMRIQLTYALPLSFYNQISIGSRVVVPLGKNKRYSAIVSRIHFEEPQAYEVKEVEDLIDELAIVTEQQILLWQWMAGYYMCSVGEVYKAALPSGLKLENELLISLKESFDESLLPMASKADHVLIEKLQKAKSLTMSEAAKLLNKKQIHALVKRLSANGVIELKDAITTNYKEKTQKFVQLTSEYDSIEGSTKAFELVSNAPKQENILLSYLSLSKAFSEQDKKVSLKQLLDHTKATHAQVNALADKGILMIYEEVIGRLKPRLSHISPLNALSTSQEEALIQIEDLFGQQQTCLLNGVTASGKTEVYIHLIQKYLNENKTVLYLLPEIALTTQIIDRLSKFFGDKVAVYHSKYNDAERIEIWNEMLKGASSKYKIILGVRSSIFLPFHNLGLIIVDEEHENTYKQYAPAPRYHARDVAIVLAQQYKAKVLLGTATPSLETYHNCQQGKYAQVFLNSRFNEVAQPHVRLVDIVESRRKKQWHSSFSKDLLEAIKNNLSLHKQIILFQNRRGYSPYIECKTCGWVANCEHCNVSLTYHKFSNNLQCHYCGYTIAHLTHCKACGSPALETKGLGTEKLEDEIKIFFPEAKVARLDLDTTRNKHAATDLIYQFQNGDIDILVGTQMVSKGLDFSNVGLVGIINADQMLSYPDFRSEERTYQLITQVSGRAGRRDGNGQVIVQSSQIQHPVIQQALTQDNHDLYQTFLSERYEFGYPPYVRLIELTLKHKQEHLLLKAALILQKDLNENLSGIPILGPQVPIINRIQNYYLSNILIKLPKNQYLDQYKAIILQRTDAIRNVDVFKSLIVQIDVDPY